MSGELGKATLDLEVESSKADAGLKSFEQKVKTTAAKVANDGEAAGSGFITKFAKGFAALGAIEGAFKGLTAAAKFMKGDMEGALDSLQSLPLGIGPVIGSIRGLVTVLNGSAEALKMSAEAAEKLKAALAGIGTEKSFLKQLEEISFEAEMVGKTHLEKAAARFQRNASNALIDRDFGTEIQPADPDLLGNFGGQVLNAQQLIKTLETKNKLSKHAGIFGLEDLAKQFPNMDSNENKVIRGAQTQLHAIDRGKFSFSKDKELNAIEASKFGKDTINKEMANQLALISKLRREKQDFLKDEDKSPRAIFPSPKQLAFDLKKEELTKGINKEIEKHNILATAKVLNNTMQGNKINLLQKDEQNRISEQKKKDDEQTKNIDSSLNDFFTSIVDKELSEFFTTINNEVKDEADAAAEAAKEAMDQVGRTIKQNAEFARMEAEDAADYAERLTKTDKFLDAFFDGMDGERKDDKVNLFKDITLSLQAMSFDQPAMTKQKVVDEDAKEQRKGMLLYLQTISRKRAEAGLA